MTYGYTIADAADRNVFEEAVSFIVEKLHFKPKGDTIEDVDGSLKRTFTMDDNNLTLESNNQVDYVAILSDVSLPITCLNKWTF